MNFHNDMWITEQVQKHYKEAQSIIDPHRIVGVFYQGSGNYDMDYEGSDVDTKCIIVPTIQQLHDEERTSYTHVRNNDEHIDFKDVRNMFELFRKCNVNFLEILFTDYACINPLYWGPWLRVRELRNKIVDRDKMSIVKSLKGIAGEKYHAMEHRYPSRIEWLDKWGYDPKQLHHLMRIEEFMQRYIHGVPFSDCLKSQDADRLICVKKGCYKLEDARNIAKNSMTNIEEMYKGFITDDADYYTEVIEELNDISLDMIKLGIVGSLI